MNEIKYRKAKPTDSAALAAIDSSFTTEYIYTVQTGESGFTLTEVPVDPPFRKEFPDEGDDSDDEDGEEGDEDGNTSTLVAEDPLLNSSSSTEDSSSSPHGDPTTTTTTPTPTNIIGFIRTKYHTWNHRLLILDISIQPSHRGRGIGRTLIDPAEKEARENFPALACVWLEMSSVNWPGIRSYLGMGFRFCGVDVSLYEGTESRGEVAVFMWRK